jgi:perosamine synthetase
MHRREFIKTTTAATAALGLTSAFAETPTKAARPAILGGQAVHPEAWPTWPVIDESDEKAFLGTLKSRAWFRYGGTQQVAGFEEMFAKRAGTKRCIATSSGTSALYTALGALEIGPGDEVILPPYTFIATYNVIVLNYALPIFVDVDVATSQIDASKIEAAITENTKVIMPVQLGGNVSDMDKITAIASKHKLNVVEDACQAHLAEWKGKVVGNWGLCGCFSFQASKNLNSGEGGAILTNNEEFADLCSHFQDQGRERGKSAFAYSGNRGTNLRMTEFQGTLLKTQMARLEAQAKRRDENAKYLSDLLREIPGITPPGMYKGCTRNAYHLYMFRYNPEPFGGLPRDKFIAALEKEGVPVSGGYGPMNRDTYVQTLRANKHFQRLYSKADLDRWEQHTHCPQNDKLCAEALWFYQTMLLAQRSDMDKIAEAIRKIQAHAAEIAKA